MEIALATPLRPGETSGNSVTSTRWSRRLHELGHDVTFVEVDEDGGFDPTSVDSADLLVVLHAGRSASVARRWHKSGHSKPLIVALAGTDLYRDMPEDVDAMHSVGAANALVVLQPAAVDRLASLSPEFAAKAVVIHQSVEGPLPRRSVDASIFRVVVIAHLRDVKDPLLCARATRLLPASSRVVVDHAGSAHSVDWNDAAMAEMSANGRYRWIGSLPPDEALRLIASSSVLACTSRLEGGANVVTEAIALGVPVIGTDIDGNRGLLGPDYPGLVPVGDVRAMADLLGRLESDASFLAELQMRVDALRPITDVANERSGWAKLLSRFV